MFEITLNTENAVQKSILIVLEYYAIFNYPLKPNEIYGACPQACTLSCIFAALEALEHDQKIYVYKGYYFLKPGVSEAVKKRQTANELAKQKLEKAKRSGKFISRFPFVKFVGISGSLSKGYADERSDYDFFIITAENRLWICRTILHLFKKFTFIAGKQHHFCMNYFIDESHKEISEKNIFTATELSSLIPISAPGMYIQFMSANRWVKNFFPNGYLPFCKQDVREQHTTGIIKTLSEKVINMIFPDKLNKFFMTLTDNKWRRKWKRKKYPMEDYDLAFKTTLYISKNHALNYQKKVLTHLSKIRQ